MSLLEVNVSKGIPGVADNPPCIFRNENCTSADAPFVSTLHLQSNLVTTHHQAYEPRIVFNNLATRPIDRRYKFHYGKNIFRVLKNLNLIPQSVSKTTRNRVIKNRCA